MGQLTISSIVTSSRAVAAVTVRAMAILLALGVLADDIALFVHWPTAPALRGLTIALVGLGIRRVRRFLHDHERGDLHLAHVLLMIWGGQEPRSVVPRH